MIGKWVGRLRAHILSDHLFRNSVYLILTTAVMGLLGFFFWLIAAHIFTQEEIGVGTTLVSVMTLISTASLLGFNSTFVRTLAGAHDRDRIINTGSVLVLAAAAVMAAGYVALAPLIAPQQAILRSNPWYALGFIFMVALASINTLTDSIFIAYRSAEYNLITDGAITAGAKLLLPFAFVALGAYGVFAASGLAASIGMVASILFLVYKFGYKPRISVDIALLKRVFKFSSANYVANLLGSIPQLILPIIVINGLGAAAAADYYLAFMVINLLYAVGTSVAQSLFAEGSHDTQALRRTLKRSIAILATIMVPAAVVLAEFGPLILEVFGRSYRTGGADVMVVLALGAPIVAATQIGSTLLRIRRQIYSLVLMNVVYAAAVSGLALIWVRYGLVWIGAAWIVGSAAAVIVGAASLFRYRGNPTPSGI